MAKFLVNVRRVYRQGEYADISVDAPTPEAALAKAKRIECDDGLDWSEDEGGSDGADVDSYQWTVTDRRTKQEVLIGTGTNDGED